jgi:hypothetical protein
LDIPDSNNTSQKPRRITIGSRQFTLPQSRSLRITIGCLFVFLGLLGFLPILAGFADCAAGWVYGGQGANNANLPLLPIRENNSRMRYFHACRVAGALLTGPRLFAGRDWPRGGVVTQRTANPCTPVRFRARPPTSFNLLAT